MTDERKLHQQLMLQKEMGRNATSVVGLLTSKNKCSAYDIVQCNCLYLPSVILVPSCVTDNSQCRHERRSNTRLGFFFKTPAALQQPVIHAVNRDILPKITFYQSNFCVLPVLCPILIWLLLCLKFKKSCCVLQQMLLQINTS